MIGIGPFITQPDTPFREFTSGELTLCLRMVAIFETPVSGGAAACDDGAWDDPSQWQRAGAFSGSQRGDAEPVVVMPNLYDNKICR